MSMYRCIKLLGNILHQFPRNYETISGNYPGFPPILASPQFRKRAEEVGIHLQFSGINDHNSIGQGERYHNPLQETRTIINEFAFRK